MNRIDLQDAQKKKWFATVIHHAALRSKRRYRRWQKDALILNQTANNSSVEMVDSIPCSVAELEFKNTEFEQMFTKLPMIQRRVMIDLYVRELTQQQAALDISISQQQVSRLRDRALSALRREVVMR